MKVAVVGATGMVGTVMLKVLAERNFPTEEVESRLEEILIKEGEVTEYLPWRPAIH